MTSSAETGSPPSDCERARESAASAVGGGAPSAAAANLALADTAPNGELHTPAEVVIDSIRAVAFGADDERCRTRTSAAASEEVVRSAGAAAPPIFSLPAFSRPLPPRTTVTVAVFLLVESAGSGGGAEAAAAAAEAAAAAAAAAVAAALLAASTAAVASAATASIPLLRYRSPLPSSSVSSKASRAARYSLGCDRRCWTCLESASSRAWTPTTPALRRAWTTARTD